MSSRPLPPGSGSMNANVTPPVGRRSYALESLSHRLQELDGLQILDMGGINQANLDYVTGMGHRLYAEDLLRAYDSFFTLEEIQARQFSGERVEAFLDETFDFADQTTDGALMWDTLQFLPLSLSQPVLDRIHRILSPDALVMALFHPESTDPAASPYQCRIQDTRHLLVTPRTVRRVIEPFSARSIERLFQRFRTVKFFLTRENLQEVIARR